MRMKLALSCHFFIHFGDPKEADFGSISSFDVSDALLAVGENQCHRDANIGEALEDKFGDSF